MFGLEAITQAVTVELTRAITGRLFTEDQIRTVTKSAIGKYFSDFFPEIFDGKKARDRVEEARTHIDKASSIIGQMQTELAQQSEQLDMLLVEVEDKKKLAERYSQLATANRQLSDAMRAEMEEMLRKELIAQAEKGRKLRQLASFAIWLVTLVLGAWLGTYFKDVLVWLMTVAA
jgi:hypothetical protein